MEKSRLNASWNRGREAPDESRATATMAWAGTRLRWRGWVGTGEGRCLTSLFTMPRVGRVDVMGANGSVPTENVALSGMRVQLRMGVRACVGGDTVVRTGENAGVELLHVSNNGGSKRELGTREVGDEGDGLVATRFCG